eukprot:COSAG01_NODE_707_length_14133_cov_34.324093_8_plen_49_part_00
MLCFVVVDFHFGSRRVLDSATPYLAIMQLHGLSIRPTSSRMHPGVMIL